MALTTTVNPGDKIQSAWGNQIRDRSIQQFASTAELLAQWVSAPVGATALAGNRLYRKFSSGWFPIDGPMFTFFGEAYAAGVTGGIWDYHVTLPTMPVAGVFTVDFSGWGGFSSANLTSTYLAMYSNNYNSPAGGAWLVNGVPVNNLASATWTAYGSLILSLPVAAGAGCTISCRWVWAPAANNFHVRGTVRGVYLQTAAQ